MQGGKDDDGSAANQNFGAFSQNQNVPDPTDWEAHDSINSLLESQLSSFKEFPCLGLTDCEKLMPICGERFCRKQNMEILLSVSNSLQ